MTPNAAQTSDFGRAAISNRWREVHPTYVSTFGPDAAAIGVPTEWEDVHGEAQG